MGRHTVLLLLLAFLTLREGISVPLALRALSNLHRSASFTSRPAVPTKYTVHYLQQKVRRGGAGVGEDWGFPVPLGLPRSPGLTHSS